jgi:hypothetical protein
MRTGPIGLRQLHGAIMESGCSVHRGLMEKRFRGGTATVEQFHAAGPSLAGMVTLNSSQNEQLMPAAIAMILAAVRKNARWSLGPTSLRIERGNRAHE